jgi:uncharacterized protein
MSANIDVVRRLFRAVEKRDLATVLDSYHEDIEINESGSLPYGGVYHGHDGVRRHAEQFMNAWGEYQGEDEVKLDATFTETDDGRVVALFRHRAFDPERGERLDTPEIGVYEVREGKVARSQMFHFDPLPLDGFLNARSSR